MHTGVLRAGKAPGPFQLQSENTVCPQAACPRNSGEEFGKDFQEDLTRIHGNSSKPEEEALFGCPWGGEEGPRRTGLDRLRGSTPHMRFFE